MNQPGQVRPAEPADEARQPGGVVEMPVAADDGLDARGILAQPTQVLRAAIRCQAGIEQQPVRLTALADLDQRGEPVLGFQLLLAG